MFPLDDSYIAIVMRFCVLDGASPKTPHAAVQQQIISNSDLLLTADSQQYITIAVAYCCRKMLDRTATALSQPPYSEEGL